jgi:hypothetical protein
MRNIVRLLVTMLFLLFVLVVAFCPKTAMAQGPVSIGLPENDGRKRYRQDGPCVPPLRRLVT